VPEDSNIYVIDSSVAIKWLTNEEPFKEEAVKVFDDYFNEKIELVVPDIFWWELGNYFGRKLDSKTAYISIQTIKKNRMRTYMLSNDMFMKSLRIMTKDAGISFYDASYHALAIQIGGTFLTSDKKYYQKKRRLGSIQLLENYGA